MLIENNNVWRKVFKYVLPSSDFVDFRKQAKDELYHVSLIKWFNMYRKLSFVFEKLDLINLCPGKPISEALALQYFKPSKNNFRVFPIKTFQKFKNKHTNPNSAQLTNGHDLVTRLAGIFRHRFKKQISDKDLRECLCQNFTENEAKRTKLFESLEKWCKENKVNILR